MTEGVRLAKRLAEQLGCSRREAELYIEGGWVQVDGQVIEEPQHRVDSQTIKLDPEATLITQPPITLLLHKPPGFEAGLGPATTGDPRAGPRSSHGSRSRGAPPALQLLTRDNHAADDRSGQRLLKRHFSHLEAPAPLPSEASGLVVYTQDARIVRKLLEDADTIEQEVVVEVSGEVTPRALGLLSHGLSFNGRALPPIKVSINSQSPTQTRLRFALKGVRPGQIPSMLDSVGLKILAMKRLRIGRVSMGQLAPSQWRYLPAHERF